MAVSQDPLIPEDYEDELRENVEDIPDHIEERTKAMFWTAPPSNPNVVMEVAQWWYKNGRGGSDPIYKHCIAHLASQSVDDITEPIDTWQEGRDYMEALGFEEEDGP